MEDQEENRKFHKGFDTNCQKEMFIDSFVTMETLSIINASVFKDVNVKVEGI